MRAPNPAASRTAPGEPLVPPPGEVVDEPETGPPVSKNATNGALPNGWPAAKGLVVKIDRSDATI
jgi:hypothetical protein